MHMPSKITLQKTPPCLNDVALDSSFIDDKDTYETKLKRLQKRILTIQQAYHHQHKRAIIVFEGWDASGKGGAIRRLTERLDPRGFHVHPIGAPSPNEQGRHYLYRFQARLPKPQSWAIFDRSWYGRVLVERVEALCPESHWQRAYQEINEFERMLMDDEVRIVKLFLHIDQNEQLHRFQERLNNPYKRWKLTSEDIRNREKWPQYSTAINDMLSYTSTRSAPWHLIAANHKWYARIKVLKTIADALSDGVDMTPPPLDPAIIREAEQKLGIKAKT
ncbi:polyphosphate kinase [Pontibacterium sp. N1Y112]|uniref:Polyphosphate kinase n=1 Tax=Pontibacterium sinense TaxID=2781979 RepID=A0A8J7K5Q9_9GAMM|nr:polyphosphate kinase [Pontibacterium sinense]MBE9395891.1 polyphosphate kinase [Pontibacterium sinense]